MVCCGRRRVPPQISLKTGQKFITEQDAIPFSLAEERGHFVLLGGSSNAQRILGYADVIPPRGNLKLSTAKQARPRGSGPRRAPGGRGPRGWPLGTLTQELPPHNLRFTRNFSRCWFT